MCRLSNEQNHRWLNLPGKYGNIVSGDAFVSGCKGDETIEMKGFSNNPGEQEYTSFPILSFCNGYVKYDRTRTVGWIWLQAKCYEITASISY